MEELKDWALYLLGGVMSVLLMVIKWWAGRRMDTVDNDIATVHTRIDKVNVLVAKHETHLAELKTHSKYAAEQREKIVGTLETVSAQVTRIDTNLQVLMSKDE